MTFYDMSEWELSAYSFAYIKHMNQLDDEGKDYFESHVLDVVRILKNAITNKIGFCLLTEIEHCNRKDMVQAAYLHDTIEDTDTTYEEIENKFGKTVADLVMELTHEGKKDSYGYYFPRLKSKAAIIIKFCDRLSNLTRMNSWDIGRQKHYLKKSRFWKESLK